MTLATMMQYRKLHDSCTRIAPLQFTVITYWVGVHVHLCCAMTGCSGDRCCRWQFFPGRSWSSPDGPERLAMMAFQVLLWRVDRPEDQTERWSRRFDK